MALTKEQLLAQVPTLKGLLDREIVSTIVSGEPYDVTQINGGSPIKVEALIDFLAQRDALDSIFAVQGNATIDENGTLSITAQQGTKGAYQVS